MQVSRIVEANVITTLVQHDGMEAKFPICHKAEYIDYTIKNFVWAFHYKMPKGKLPAIKDALWSELGFKRVHDLARYKADQKGTMPQDELHKALWQVLYNRPSALVIYTTKMDEYLWGVVKFALQYGITVPLEDTRTGFKGQLRPVINLSNELLFKTHKVEEFFKERDNLDQKTKEAVETKHQLLMDLRSAFKDLYVWPRLNDEIAELKALDTSVKAESAYERYQYALRYYVLKTQIPQYKLGLHINDFTTSVIDKIKADLRKDARYYGFDLRLEEYEHNTMSYKPRHWFKPPLQLQGKTRPKTLLVDGVGLSKTNELKQLRAGSTLPELVDATMQLQYYKAHNIVDDINPEDVLASNTVLCPNCGTAGTLRTARRNWELYGDARNLCMLCDTELPELDFEVTSYDPVEYMIEDSTADVEGSAEMNQMQ